MLNNDQLVKLFKYCPYCTQKLQQHPIFVKSGAKYCPTDGEFFIQKTTGDEPVILFKKFDGRQHRSRWNAGRPNARIRCNQTGEVFKNQTEIVNKMGLHKGNLSAHILGKGFANHVNGYTFTIVDE